MLLIPLYIVYTFISFIRTLTGYYNLTHFIIYNPTFRFYTLREGFKIRHHCT